MNNIEPIILNYHNHYSGFEENEEIFYERTGRVLYKVQRDDAHPIWPTSREEMEKDRMYYEFKDRKFKTIRPEYFGSIETPAVCRAIRHGMVLKLEDLYTPFIQAVDMVSSTIKAQLSEPEESKENFVKHTSERNTNMIKDDDYHL